MGLSDMMGILHCKRSRRPCIRCNELYISDFEHHRCRRPLYAPGGPRVLNCGSAGLETLESVFQMKGKPYGSRIEYALTSSGNCRHQQRAVDDRVWIYIVRHTTTHTARCTCPVTCEVRGKNWLEHPYIKLRKTYSCQPASKSSRSAWLAATQSWWRVAPPAESFEKEHHRSFPQRLKQSWRG